MVGLVLLLWSRLRQPNADSIGMSTAIHMLALYLAAETTVLSGQRFRMGERELTRADLAEIRADRR